MYYWRAYSDDGCFEDESDIDFKTEKEAYNDMRNSVFEKMKWNTEYDEDYDETEMILYEVEFSQNKIIHNSYSGIYTYEIFDRDNKEIDNMEYRTAIVDETGCVMWWCDELQGNEQIECILVSHPEWSMKAIEQ